MAACHSRTRRPPLGRTLAEELLEPTEIYVRAALDAAALGSAVRGLAHITGDGLLNLTRLNDSVGFRIDAPLSPPPIFELIQERGEVPDQEMWEVFNMGTGFCCVVAPSGAEQALDLLRRHHAGAAPIGEVTDEAGVVQASLRGPGRRTGRLPALLSPAPQGGGREEFRRRAPNDPSPEGARQAASHIQPVSTRIGRTRQFSARRHSSACARGPGRSHSNSTSPVVTRPNRAHDLLDIEADVLSSRSATLRRPPVRVERLKAGDRLAAVLPREHRRRKGGAAGALRGLLRSCSLLGRQGRGGLEVRTERLGDRVRAQSEAKPLDVESGLARGFDQRLGVIELQRSHMIPSRSRRRYAKAASVPCSAAARTAMQAG